MPCGLGQIGRKIRSLFRRRTNGRGLYPGLKTELEGQPTDFDSGLAGEEASNDAPLLGASSGLVPGSPSASAFDHRANSNNQDSTVSGLNPDLAHTRPVRISSHSPVHPLTPAPSAQPAIPPSTSSMSSPPWQGHESCPTPATSTTSGSSYFPGAHGFHIQNQQIITTNSASPKSLFEHLKRYISHGAAHNSNERCDAPACHEETRVAVRQGIVSWIKHGEAGDELKRIMWLGGPAGGGKTAIAGSVAEECKKEGLLAASFFFSSVSGSVDRRSKRCVITTIASHLAEHQALHEFKTQLLVSIERNPAIFQKRLKEQAECLILEPLRCVQDRRAMTSWPKGIILDGLDEVEAEQYHDPSRQEADRKHDYDQLEILKALLILSQSPSFPFRIFIASRPERHICDFFDAATAQAATVKLFLDSKYNADADIRLFLESKFADIRCRAGISNVLWPGQPALDRLVDMSSGQFIVPTTIIRWIDAGVPQQQLDEVLQVQHETAGSRNPFASLDALYSHILKRARNPDGDSRLVVKWVVSTYSAHVSGAAPAWFWRQFFEDWEGELNYRMAPITSLISIPPPNNTRSPITLYHKSLTDFLSTEARCGADLYVDNMALNSFIADRVLGVLKNKGPCVPHSLSDADLCRFMCDLLGLKRVIRWDDDMFLSHLDGTADAGATLASCDVAWWTSVFLCQDLRALGLYPLSEIYFRIHGAMKCPVGTGSSTQHATHEGWDTKCHAACIHWRRGILASMKELGWCVHELEGLELDDLGSVPGHEAYDMFETMGQQHDGSFLSCSICQPVSSCP